MQELLIKENELHLIGLSTTLTLHTFNPSVVWREFRQQFREMEDGYDGHLYNVKVLPPSCSLSELTPAKEFTLWAAREFNPPHAYPANWKTLLIPKGEYAVFNYKGNAANFASFYRNLILHEIPFAGLECDARPAFERFLPGYDPTDDQSEEEVWIPVKNR
jgi:AraC family transcriptional regulator